MRQTQTQSWIWQQAHSTFSSDRFRIPYSKTTWYLQSFSPTAIWTYIQSNDHVDTQSVQQPCGQTISPTAMSPCGHTINKQADEHNTQWLEMRMKGRWGWDKMEECLGMNRRQLFAWVSTNQQIPSEASEEPSDTVIHFDFYFFFFHMRALLSANQRQCSLNRANIPRTCWVKLFGPWI